MKNFASVAVLVAVVGFYNQAHNVLALRDFVYFVLYQKVFFRATEAVLVGLFLVFLTGLARKLWKIFVSKEETAADALESDAQSIEGLIQSVVDYALATFTVENAKKLAATVANASQAFLNEIAKGFGQTTDSPKDDDDNVAARQVAASVTPVPAAKSARAIVRKIAASAKPTAEQKNASIRSVASSLPEETVDTSFGSRESDLAALLTDESKLSEGGFSAASSVVESSFGVASDDAEEEEENGDDSQSQASGSYIPEASSYSAASSFAPSQTSRDDEEEEEQDEEEEEEELEEEEAEEEEDDGQDEEVSQNFGKRRSFLDDSFASYNSDASFLSKTLQ